MAAAHGSQALSYDTPRSADCVSQIMNGAATGIAIGAVATVALVAFRGASASSRLNTAAQLRTLALDVIPLTATAGVLFSGVSCVAESSRGQRDWTNSFIGGSVAAGVVFGAKRRSLVAAVVGGFVGGLVAAGPEVASMLSLSPSEAAQADRDLMTPTSSSPRALAANVAGTQRVNRQLA